MGTYQRDRASIVLTRVELAAWLIVAFGAVVAPLALAPPFDEPAVVRVLDRAEQLVCLDDDPGDEYCDD